jgi:hypothetical protein
MLLICPYLTVLANDLVVAAAGIRLMERELRLS